MFSYRRNQPVPVVSGPTRIPENAILRVFMDYPYLTCEQVCKLLYSRGLYSLGSLTWIGTKLASLADTRRRFLLRRFHREGYPDKGTYLYTLGRHGLNYLAAFGHEIPKRFHPTEKLAVWKSIPHTLAVNDFLINFQLFSRNHPEYRINTLLHDRILKKRATQRIATEGGYKLVTDPAILTDWLSCISAIGIADATHRRLM